jgi:hypothetical protein
MLRVPDETFEHRCVQRVLEQRNGDLKMNATFKSVIPLATLSVWTGATWAQKNDVPQQGSTTYVAYCLNHVLSNIDMGEQVPVR